MIERLARNSGWDDTPPIFCLLLLFWFFFDSWQDEVLNIAKIGLLNRTFNSKGQVLCLLRKMWHHVDVDHDLRNMWNLTLVEMIIRRKVVYIFVFLKKYRSLCAQHQKPTGWKQIETFLKMTLKDTNSYNSTVRRSFFTHTTKNCSVEEKGLTAAVACSLGHQSRKIQENSQLPAVQLPRRNSSRRLRAVWLFLQI